MLFHVLGALELHSDNGVAMPRGPKIQKVLGLLVMRANRLVRIDTLIDELWRDDPPLTALTSLRTHIYHIRGMVRDLFDMEPDRLINTLSGGYRLNVDPACIDSEVFARHYRNAKELLNRGDLEGSSYRLTSALDLWQGHPLENVPVGPVLSPHTARLCELRLNAVQLRISIDMKLGRHSELIGELRENIAADPFNEWFHARLIDVLKRSGRRSEALDAFRSLRTHLNEELGVEPSPEVQREHLALLRSG